MGQSVHFDMGSGDSIKVNRLVCQDPLPTELSYCPHWMFCSSMHDSIEVTENTLQEETLYCKGLGSPVSYFPHFQPSCRWKTGGAIEEGIWPGFLVDEPLALLTLSAVQCRGVGSECDWTQCFGCRGGGRIVNSSFPPEEAGYLLVAQPPIAGNEG